MKTIEQVEVQFQQKVHGVLKDLDLLPEGHVPRVRFHGKKKDKKRTASADSFRADDSIRISFEPVGPVEQTASQQSHSPTLSPLAEPSAASEGLGSTSPSDPVSDLIRALDRAEARPGYHFVALKWFRDAALPAEGFSWASSDQMRQSVLRDAIARRFVLTNKVENPKSPAFPVTTIRLNRLMPEVKATLGQRDEDTLDFHPVTIRGESLSATVLRERR
jgi:hypothetical protein